MSATFMLNMNSLDMTRPKPIFWQLELDILTLLPVYLNYTMPVNTHTIAAHALTMCMHKV